MKGVYCRNVDSRRSPQSRIYGLWFSGCVWILGVFCHVFWQSYQSRWPFCGICWLVNETEKRIIWLSIMGSKSEWQGQVHWGLRRVEGIALDKASISKTLEKLKLNSVWGKWAQNQNKTQTSIVDSGKEFYELLTNPSTEVTNLIFRKMKWHGNLGNIPRVPSPLGKLTLAVAAYVTTQSRLKLYEYLIKLGKSVLYCHTYSVIYIQNVDETQNLK